MNRLDIRVPMGVMFVLLGVVLSGYGAISNGSAQYQRSLQINVNLWWGAIILLFGATLLALAWRASRIERRRLSPSASPMERGATSARPPAV